MSEEHKFKITYRSAEQIDKCLDKVIECRESMIQLRKVLEEEMDGSVSDLTLLSDINNKIFGLRKLWEYLSNLPKKQNGYLNLMDLEVGVKFRVLNGQWDGEIVDDKGVKSVKHINGVFPITPTNCTSFDIKITNPKSLKCEELLECEELFRIMHKDNVPY